MSQTELGFMPASEVARLVLRRQLSPVESVEAILQRMASQEPQLNAMTSIFADRARADARAAEAAVLAREDLPPLHGVTVTLKDITAVAGAPFEAGSKAFKGRIAINDAPIVTRLRKAGAIVIGKTTTSELAWSAISTSPASGTTHNPWKHGYNAGASSGGAGAAAAAGYGPLHQGSDGAGSIRIPASFCGVYGLKPTFGRVPYSPHVNLDSISHIGPLTRTVLDAALMLEAMAGPHRSDHTSCETGPRPYSRELNVSLKCRRIAYSPDLGFARVDPEVAALTRKAALAFSEDLGAEVEEVTPPWGDRGSALIQFMWPTMLSGLRGMLPKWEAAMDPGLVACIKEGMKTTAAEYFEHRARKLAYMAEIAEWFEQWDILLTPTVSVSAFPAGLLQPSDWPAHAWNWLSWAQFSYPFNFAHNPAASVPCGFTTQGLPVGLQIVGRRFDDLGVLQASAAFEMARPWAHFRPGA